MLEIVRGLKRVFNVDCMRELFGVFLKLLMLDFNFREFECDLVIRI